MSKRGDPDPSTRKTYSKERAEVREQHRLRKQREEEEAKGRVAAAKEEKLKKKAEKAEAESKPTGAKPKKKVDESTTKTRQEAGPLPVRPRPAEEEPRDPLSRREEPPVEARAAPRTPEQRVSSGETSPFVTPEGKSYKEEFPTPAEVKAQLLRTPQPPRRTESLSTEAAPEETRSEPSQQPGGSRGREQARGAAEATESRFQQEEPADAPERAGSDGQEDTDQPDRGQAGDAGAGGGPPDEGSSESESSDEEGDRGDDNMAARIIEAAATAVTNAAAAANVARDNAREDAGAIDVTTNPAGAKNLLSVLQTDLKEMATQKTQLDQAWGTYKAALGAEAPADAWTNTYNNAAAGLRDARALLIQLISQIDGQRKDVPTKPNTSLKPEPLTFDNTPIELNHWRLQFEGYYNTSRFADLGQTEQEAYLISCLSSDVATVLRSLKETDANSANYIIAERTLPNGAKIPSMLDLLDRMWLDRYPLFKRRHEYFTMEFQGSLRNLPEFLGKIEDTFRIAKVSELTADKLNAYRALSAVKDEELRRLCWREADLTWDKLRALAFQRVKEVENKNYGKSARERANAAQAQFKCYACQKPGHMAKNCPQKQQRGGPKRVQMGRQADDEVHADAEEDPAEEDQAQKAGVKKVQRQTKKVNKPKAQGKLAHTEEGSSATHFTSDH